MRTLPSVTAIAVPLLLITSPVRATTLIVPDDYPTIQAAIGSAADTVLVRPDSYPEDVVIDRPVALLAFQGLLSGADFPSGPDAQVSVVSLTFVTPVGPGTAVVEGLEVLGPVQLANARPGPELSITLEKCRFQSGIAQSGSAIQVGPLTVRSCFVSGDVKAQPRAIEFDSNSVIAGGVQVRCESAASFRMNSIMGPASAAIETNGEFGGARIEHNNVNGTSQGIVVLDPFGTQLIENEIADCEGTAFRMTRTPEALLQPLGTSVVTIAFNRVRSCGGHGLDILSMGGVFDVHENLIETVGGAGIHASGWAYMHVENNDVRASQGPGIWLEGDAYGEGIGENRVFDGGADGMLLESGSAVGRNVVGRCAGNGLVLGLSGGSAGGNTLFFNRGSGIEVRGPASVYNNIGYGNGHYGLASVGADPPSLGCNDWAANVLGATRGVTPDPTDLFLEPMFCDLPHDDARLSAGSPLLDAPGCGLIGALGQGCAEPAAVTGRPGLSPLALSTWPRPARERVWLAWHGVAGTARLEIYDITGALRWNAAVERESGRLEWLRRDREGRALPPGLYFVRLVNRNRVSSATIVAVR